MSSISIIEYAIGYPKKLDNETQVLKKDTVYMSLRTWRYLSVLTSELHLIDQHRQCWKTLCMGQERKGHHQAYSAVNSISYSNDQTEKTW